MGTAVRIESLDHAASGNFYNGRGWGGGKGI
jgi:hypothetical protein